MRHLAPSRLDGSRLALRQLGVAIDQRSLCKELVFLQHKRRAARYLRDDLLRWGIWEVTKAAEQREWGEVPYEVARALVEFRRNRSDTRFHVPRLWDLWPLPLQQHDQDWTRCTSTSFLNSATASRVRAMPSEIPSIPSSPSTGSPTPLPT